MPLPGSASAYGAVQHQWRWVRAGGGGVQRRPVPVLQPFNLMGLESCNKVFAMLQSKNVVEELVINDSVIETEGEWTNFWCAPWWLSPRVALRQTESNRTAPIAPDRTENCFNRTGQVCVPELRTKVCLGGWSVQEARRS